MLGKIVRKVREDVRSPADALTFMSRMVVPVDPQTRRLHGWVWGRLPRVELVDVVPAARDVDVSVLRALDRTPGTSLNLDELTNLLALVRGVGARRVLEVGTFDGNTALNLAANLPDDGTVITIDLPPDSDGSLALDVPDRFNNLTSRQRLGSQYQGSGPEHKIHQVFGDSAVLNWATFVDEALDVVFIDGCHHRDYVRVDTDNALRYLAPDGIVVWHDYGYFKDVSDVVDEVAEVHFVVALSGTRLAVGFKGRR